MIDLISRARRAISRIASREAETFEELLDVERDARGLAAMFSKVFAQARAAKMPEAAIGFLAILDEVLADPALLAHGMSIAGEGTRVVGNLVVEEAVPGRLPPGSYSFADGSMFNLLTPDPALISLDLIAIGLAKTCRYSGQLPGDVFYSVAEHSVLVSRLVPPELALAGLLHDASEGLGLSDVVSPLKKLLPDYRVFEDRVMGAVAAAFGLHPDVFDAAEVKQADRALLEAEQVQIRGRPARRPVDDRYAEPADLEAAGLSFRCALPAEARRMFLDRYAEIAGGPAR